jgi:NADH dehydrogenase
MARHRTNDRLITVFGGSGFVGRYIVRALARQGYRIRAAVRRPDLAGHLQPLGTVGQIHAVQANLRHPQSVDRAVEGAWGVVNAVGILFESGRQSFNAVHDEGAGAVAAAAAHHNVERIVHISAIGADPDSNAYYAQSKAAGEAAVQRARADATILRPSIVFGPEDQFFNRFAAMARLSPVLPLVGANTRFQPVFVGDVGEAVRVAVEDRATDGRIYELGGPDVATFAELMEAMLKVIHRRRLILPLPQIVARFQAAILQLLPNPLLTLDQVRLLERDNIVGETALREGRTLPGLGIPPRDMAVILPTYLERFRRAGQFHSPVNNGM